MANISLQCMAKICCVAELGSMLLGRMLLHVGGKGMKNTKVKVHDS